MNRIFVASFLIAIVALQLSTASTPLTAQQIPDITVPSFFSDNMVLQRDKPTKVWGWGNAGDTVTVSFNGKSANSKVDDQGKWQIELPAMPANSIGNSIEISDSRKRSHKISNVLVGEVWFAGGQSNMAFQLHKTHEAKQDIAAADHPAIRVFMATDTPSSKPETNIRGQWQTTTPETAGAFSAVAYFFAKRIHEETGVPVGIIKSAWGGKRSEAYTSREALLANEHGKKMIAELDEMATKYDAVKAKENHEKALALWNKKTAGAREFNRGKEKSERKRLPRRPQMQKPVYENARNPTVLYNGMINPFVGYTMRGAIWYQGEANAKPGLAPIYGEMFSLMIEDWRTRWDDDFDFYFVQLANFQAVTSKPGVESDWATVQNLQRTTLSVPGTGMATINDVGAAKDIHPKDKQTVGNRLALWALKNHHNKDIVVSGPLYKSHRIEANKVIVEFDHVGGGLKSSDDKPLKRFEISADKKQWHWADANIEGNSVVVSSDKVANPVAVRYAWAANPEGANLGNKEGLPASIFETGNN